MRERFADSLKNGSGWERMCKMTGAFGSICTSGALKFFWLPDLEVAFDFEPFDAKARKAGVAEFSLISDSPYLHMS